MEAVANGEADVAAIDCVTWSLSKASRPDLVGQLRVIGMAPTVVPALPYVVSVSADAQEITAIKDGIQRCLTGTPTNLASFIQSSCDKSSNLWHRDLPRPLFSDKSLQSALETLHITGFDFDLAMETYEIAIKHLLNQYIVPLPLQQHCGWVVPRAAARAVMSSAQMAEDAANILMAFKALEEGLEKVSKHSVLAAEEAPENKFIYVGDGRFRVHVPKPMLVTSLSLPRKCIGFFGQRPKLHQLDTEADHWWYWRCWTADEAIVDAFDPDVVAAYVTGTVQPSGKSQSLTK